MLPSISSSIFPFVHSFFSTLPSFARQQYDVILHRLKKLAGQTSENDSEQIKLFLKKFQTPIIQTASQFNIEKVSWLDCRNCVPNLMLLQFAMASVQMSNYKIYIVLFSVSSLMEVERHMRKVQDLQVIFTNS